jgi:hypothetical protein
MTYEKLYWLRILVPGSLLALAIASFLTPIQNLLTYELKVLTIAGVSTVVLGALYLIFGVRKFFLKPLVWDSIHRRIFAKYEEMEPGLRKAIASGPGGEVDKIILNLHYHVIDSNDTLKFKKNLIFGNGILVSTTADAGIISALTALGHALCIPFNTRPNVIWALAAAAVSLSSFLIILPRVARRHEELVDDQLAYIAHHCRDTVSTERQQLSSMQRPTKEDKSGYN